MIATKDEKIVSTEELVHNVIKAHEHGDFDGFRIAMRELQVRISSLDAAAIYYRMVAEGTADLGAYDTGCH